MQFLFLDDIEDYSSIFNSTSVIISEEYPQRCISLKITQDNVQENQEYFSVNITNAEVINGTKDNQFMMVFLEPASTVIGIEDDDSKL